MKAAGKKPFGTTAPKMGKQQKLGANMGGLYGRTPKKSEPDNKPPSAAKARGARMARLAGKRI